MGKSNNSVVILGAPRRAGTQPGPLRLVGFAPTEGNCFMLPSAQCEWCPWNCATQCFWGRRGSTDDFLMGDQNRPEYGMLMGQGGGELISSGNDLIRENGK